MYRLVSLLLMAIPLSAIAQHRCAENGKVMLSDRPCIAEEKSVGQALSGPAPKSIGNENSTADSSPFGAWHGQIQFQTKGTAGIEQAAVAVVATTINIDSQGRVMGSSPENGCRFRGIAIPGTPSTSIALDLTLSGCNYSGYNRRLFGTLTVSSAQKYAQFALNGSHVTMETTMFFDIKGSLRR